MATVAHVVEGALSIVIRQNGITITGTVIGIDTHADLALVQTQAGLTRTDVGAIGYPLADQESLTKGFISGIARTINVGNGPLGGLIQTDTPLNPGNSGGSLLSVDGTVVGLVDAGNTTANGIAYAMPAQTAATQLQGWREAPAPLPADSGCAAPIGPSGVSININDQSGSPDGPSIAAMFATYASGINTGNYNSAYALLSPHAQTCPPSTRSPKGRPPATSLPSALAPSRTLARRTALRSPSPASKTRPPAALGKRAATGA